MKEMYISHQCKRKVPLSDGEILKVVNLTCKAMKKAGLVSLNFITSKQIQKLNHDFRGKNKPTDILSFPTGEKGELGDLFICPAYVNSAYKDFGHSKKRHYVMLLIHGTLHLMGYDHIKDKDFSLMQKHENRIMRIAEKEIKNLK